MSAEIETHPSQIFVAGDRGTPFRGATGFLVRMFGLDVYGNWLLTPRAQKELRSVALLLLVIFMFDLGAWTLLFNSLLHASVDIFQFSWWRTGCALVGALLVASAVIIFERGFFCHDTSLHPLRTITALVLRLIVIAAAAFITAQPVELLAFRGPITTRRYEEQLRAELVEKESLIGQAEAQREKLEKSIVGLPENIKEMPVSDQLRIMRGRLNLAQNAVAQARANEQRAQNDQARTRGLVTSATSTLENQQAAVRRMVANGVDETDPTRKAAELRVLNLQDAVDRARANATAADQIAVAAPSATLGAQQELAAATEAARQAGLDVNKYLDDAKSALQQRQDIEARRRDHLRRYIGEVRKHGMRPEGVTWKPFDENDQPYVFKLNLGNVFEQLQIIEDLKDRRPARWPAITEDQKRLLVQRYGLEDDNSPDAKERRKDLAQIVTQGYRAALGIALIIPALVLATKLLLIADLKAYYSTESQAAAGNPNALAVQANPPQSWGARFGAWTRRFLAAAQALRSGRSTRQAEP